MVLSEIKQESIYSFLIEFLVFVCLAIASVFELRGELIVVDFHIIKTRVHSVPYCCTPKNDSIASNLRYPTLLLLPTPIPCREIKTLTRREKHAPDTIVGD